MWTKSDIRVLEPPSALTLSAPATVQLTCNGSDNGSVTLIASGGWNSKYQYSKNGSDYVDGATFSGLTVGSYSFSVKDDNGGIVTIPVTVVQPLVLSVPVTTVKDVENLGSSTGAISYTIVGGTGPYKASLKNNGTLMVTTQDPATATFQGLAAGTYTLTVTDGCSAMVTTSSMTVSPPPSVLTLSTSNVVQPTCNGGADGSITLLASGGWSTKYQYSKDGGSFVDGAIFSNLKAGSYSFRVKDAKGGVTELKNVVIEQPVKVGLILTPTDATCNGSSTGKIVAIPSSGQGTYTLTLIKPVGINEVLSGISTNATFLNLPKGGYSVSAVDGKGCVSDAVVTSIDEPSLLTISTLNKVDVINKDEATGSFSYSMGGGSGSYNVTLSLAGTPDRTSTMQSGNFGSLAAGNYTLTVTDSKSPGCSKSIFVAIDGPPSKLTISVSNPIQPKCNGYTNGEVTLVGQGGWPGTYQYSVNEGSFTTVAKITDLAFGTYNFRVKDSKGGITELLNYTLGQPAPISIASKDSTAVTCFGENTGSFTLTMAGGNGGYQLMADKETVFNSLLSREKLYAGYHKYVISDAKGCQYRDSIKINQPEARLSLVPTVSNHNGFSIKCSGGTDSIWVAAAGGTPGYRYKLGSGAETATPRFGGLAKDTYTVTVVDANRCTESKDVTLAEPTPVKWRKMATLNDPTCNGVANGTILLHPTGGVRGYSFFMQQEGNALSGPSSDSLFISLPNGTFYARVTDGNGCSHDTSGLSLTQPSALRVENFGTIAATCKNDLGKVAMALAGGTSPYTLTVNEASNSSAAALQLDLSAGDYTAYIKDHNGCGVGAGQSTPTASTFTISEPDSSLALASTVVPVKCFGQDNGKVTIQATGGWHSYSYTIVDALGIPKPFVGTKSDLGAGSYKILVADRLRCRDSLMVNIPQPPRLGATLSVVDASCYGERSGQISLLPTGGVAPYQLARGNIALSDSTVFSNLAVGKYSMRVRDANGCELTTEGRVNQPEMISAPLATWVDPPCGTTTGMLQVDVNGGTPAYNMQWLLGGETANGPTITNRPAGTYSLNVTDGHGCTGLFTYTLVNPDAPKLEAIQPSHLLCYGDQSGKIDFLVNGTNQPVDVTLSQDNADVFSQRFTTKQPTTVENLGAGRYKLQMVDSHGCLSADSVFVTQPPPVKLELVAKDVTCFSSFTGRITATAKDGAAPYRMVWSSGKESLVAATDSITGLPAGSYSARIIDSHGCGDKRGWLNLSATVGAPAAALAFGPAAIYSPKCANGTDGWIGVTVKGGWSSSYTYQANSKTNTSGNFYNLASTTYPVTVRDANGCSISDNIVIPATPAIKLEVAELNNLTCYQNSSGKVYLKPTSDGASSYLYRLGEGPWVSTSAFGGLAMGRYHFEIKNINECVSTLDTALTEPDQLAVTLLAISDTCGRRVGRLLPSVTGGTSPYSFSYNEKVFETALQGLAKGDYTVVAKDKNGCVGSKAQPVGEALGPKISGVDVVPTSCAEKADGRATITTLGGNGAISVTWPDNSKVGASVSGLPKGIAKAIATDAHQCRDTVTVTIPGPDPLTTTTSSAINPLCYGYDNGSITVVPVGGTQPYTVNWTNGETGIKATKLAAGSHTALVTDVHGCSSSVTKVLTDPEPIKPVIPASAILCSNQSVAVNAGYDGSSYAWTSTNGFTSNLRTVTISDAGTYTVLVTDMKGCSGAASINLTKLAQDIDADFVVTTSTNLGDTIVLVEFTLPLPDSIGWDFPGDAFTLIKREANELHIRAEKEGTFPVALTTHMGLCSERFEKTITVGPAAPKIRDVDYHPSLFSEVKLYPNPSDGLFTVEVTLFTPAPLEVGLFNTQQQRIFFQNFAPASNFSISSERLKLSAGFYLLTLKANGEMKTVKLIIQK